MRTDVHQHLWSEPLLEQLARRRELPFVRAERGLVVLYLAGERPYVIDREWPASRAAEVQRDGLDRALLCMSSPLGVECLPRRQAEPLLAAYHEGAFAAGEPFGVWGAISLERPDPADVDRALSRGCVGISLPAGALGGVGELSRMYGVLERLEESGAPLFVHPGPGPLAAAQPARASMAEPLWWPALTRYVSGLQSAWLAFRALGRRQHPNLRVIFAMLAGLAPLQGERLLARGGPAVTEDPFTFYETSSYGRDAVAAMRAAVGPGQILYGSDRPVLDPSGERRARPDWDALGEATDRALGAAVAKVAR